LFYGLSEGTRKTYTSYQSSYETFCLARAQPPYPASLDTLAEWISLRAFGSGLPGQGPLKAESIKQALAAVRSVHVDRRLPTSVFQSEYLSRIQAGIRRLQGKEDKKKAAPLSLRHLRQITSPAPEVDPETEPSVDPTTCTLSSMEIDDLNTDTALKVAWAGFLRGGEVTCEASDLANRDVFEHTKLQRRDITFADNDEHVILTLRSSKCDVEHTGVEIVLARTGTDTCPIKALRALFTLDPQPRRAPLFRASTGTFTRAKYIKALQSRLRDCGNKDWKDYTLHSPRRGAAQHAADNGILEDDIQKLGRWSSEAFKGYFHISLAYKYALNRRFQTGRARPVVHTSLNV
jgi:hypothetical protein